MLFLFIIVKIAKWVIKKLVDFTVLKLSFLKSHNEKENFRVLILAYLYVANFLIAVLVEYEYSKENFHIHFSDLLWNYFLFEWIIKVFSFISTGIVLRKIKRLAF